MPTHTVKTRQDVKDAVLGEIMRGSRYNVQIDRKIQASVRWLEQNFNMEYMRTHREFRLGHDYPIPSTAPERIYGFLVAQDPASYGGGGSIPGFYLSEHPLLIKSFIQVGIVNEGAAAQYSLTHGKTIVQQSLAGSETQNVYQLTEVPYEQMNVIAGADAPNPQTRDGKTVPVQMPTQFCFLRYEMRQEPRDASGAVAHVAQDFARVLFNGPLDTSSQRWMHALYYRYTPETPTHEFEDMVFEVAFDFLVAATMKRMAPTSRNYKAVQYWADEEAKALRVLGLAEEQRENSAQPPMSMEYVPEL